MSDYNKNKPLSIEEILERDKLRAEKQKAERRAKEAPRTIEEIMLQAKRKKSGTEKFKVLFFVLSSLSVSQLIINHQLMVNNIVSHIVENNPYLKQLSIERRNERLKRQFARETKVREEMPLKEEAEKAKGSPKYLNGKYIDSLGDWKAEPDNILTKLAVQVYATGRHNCSYVAFKELPKFDEYIVACADPDETLLPTNIKVFKVVETWGVMGATKEGSVSLYRGKDVTLPTINDL